MKLNSILKKWGARTVAVLLCGIMITSCTDSFLDRRPLGRFTEDSYPQTSVDQYVYTLYGHLRDYGLHCFPAIGILSVRSDDADKGSEPADGSGIKQMDDFENLTNNDAFKSFYTSNYTGIAAANRLLYNIEKATDLDDAKKAIFTAEAHFFRAYFYFYLVRTFGGVPKVTELITEEESFNIPRASKESIYDLIVSDLKAAIPDLPIKWGEEFKGRVTQSTAQAVLAKVYLYLEQWNNVLAQTTAVIQSGLYDMSTKYSVVFTEAGEFCSESIFEVSCLFNRTYKYGCSYAAHQGIRGAGSLNLGWGFNTPSEQLIAAYETGDPRKDATVLFRGETTNYGEFLPASLPNKYYNKKVYTDPRIRKEVNSNFGEWVNIRLLRYPDVLLMHAEAANEVRSNKAMIDDALEKLEMVRERARRESSDPSTMLPKVVERDKDLLRKHIQHERRIEFAMENERFFDLVRWDIAEEVMHAAGKTKFLKGRDELLPIPQDEIDKSNGVLTQNPGPWS